MKQDSTNKEKNSSGPTRKIRNTKHMIVSVSWMGWAVVGWGATVGKIWIANQF